MIPCELMFGKIRVREGDSKKVAKYLLASPKIYPFHSMYLIIYRILYGCFGIA